MRRTTRVSHKPLEYWRNEYKEFGREKQSGWPGGEGPRSPCWGTGRQHGKRSPTHHPPAVAAPHGLPWLLQPHLRLRRMCPAWLVVWGRLGTEPAPLLPTAGLPTVARYVERTPDPVWPHPGDKMPEKKKARSCAGGSKRTKQ